MEIKAELPKYQVPINQDRRWFRILCLTGLTDSILLEASAQLGIEHAKIGDIDGDTWSRLEQLCREKIEKYNRPMKIPKLLRN